MSPSAASLDTWREYKRLRTEIAEIELPQFGAIRITGREWREWMQGQITQDVRLLTPDQSIDFCMCSATGQMQAVGTLHEIDGTGLVIMDRELANVLMKRVETMVILEEVFAEDLREELRLVHLTGPEATIEEKRAEIIVPSRRYGQPGWDLLIPANRKPRLPDFDPEALDLARLEAGQPIFGIEMNERTLPPEMGPAFESQTVHYVKGCYTGQEVLQRIHSRGHTNKTWVALLGDAPVQAGDRVLDEHGDDVGVVLSVAHSPEFGHFASAMLKNQASEDGMVHTIHAESGEVSVTVRAFPLFDMPTYPVS